ncbi:MAG TPA: hypothetical protein VHT75_17820 [Acidimicrobiales bacterium]|jgi:hypothetical protein|nr:hypothetical protein [Acidimicrobiales bacterium]
MEKNSAICAVGAAVIAGLFTVSLIVVSNRGGIHSTAAKAAFVARVAATVVGHAASDITSSGTTVAPPTLPTAAAGTTPAPANTAPTGAAATGTTAGAGSHGTPATASGTSHPPTAGTAAAPASAPTASTLPPRTQPTAVQVKEAITAFQNAVPFFTPTAAQIADVGNQVCTDFDHGMTFAQITSKALDMVGAGALSFLIPASVPAQAVRTLVKLYCPGYAPRLG